MDRGRPKKLSGLGARTGKNVLLNKNIRKLPDGRDNYEDYFTDTSDESESTYIGLQSPRRSLRNSVAVNHGNSPPSSPVKTKSASMVIGSRSKKNILPRKDIRKLSNGMDNYEDYFSDCVSCENTSVSTIPGNLIPSPASKESSKDKISAEISPGIVHSSPITRLPSRKAIYKYADNSSGSELESSEEDFPLISNTSISRSKISARKSIHKKQDSCDAKLLKMAEDYEKIESVNDHGSQLEAIKSVKSNKLKILNTSQRNASKSPVKKTASKVSPEKTYLIRSASVSPVKKTTSNDSPEKNNLTRSASVSPVKKTTSNVSPEKNCLTRSRSPKGTPTKLNNNNLLVKPNDKNISLKKNSRKQSISKAPQSSALESKLLRSKFEQSNFDVNTTQNDESDMNPVPEQDNAMNGYKSSTSKLLLKKRKSMYTSNTASKLNLKKTMLTPNTASKLPLRKKSKLTPNIVNKLLLKTKSNLTPDTASKLPLKRKSNLPTDIASKLPIKRKLNLTPNTASKKKINLVVDSSMHGKNDQVSEDLLDVDFNIVNPQGSSSNNEGNSNDYSLAHEKEKADSNPSKTLDLNPKTGSKLPRKSVSFGLTEKQHHLAATEIDDIPEITNKNILKNKQVRTENTSNSNELQRRKSVRNHSDINYAQDSDSEDDTEENSAAQKENASHHIKDVAGESNLTPLTAGKKKAKSFVASAKKHKTAKELKEKDSLSLSLFDKNSKETRLNIQLLDSSPDHVLNATIKGKNSTEMSADGHKNSENGEKKKQTGKRKKASKSQENEDPAVCRRSTRNRFPLLESWRSQRPRYRIENGSIHLVDIDPGNKEDDGAKKALAARLFKIKENPKKKPVKNPKIKINDVILNKKVTLSLLKPFNAFPWEGQSNKESSYHVKKIIQTSSSNFGFIEIKVGQSKSKQYLPSEDIYLCLIQGELKALVGEREIIIGEKDTIVIPRSIPYSLMNTGQKKALIVYSVGKYNFLESALYS